MDIERSRNAIDQKLLTIMTAPNHITGGFAITGVIAALLDINILEDKLLIGVVILGSLLADIDHNKSLIGKIAFPISTFIQRHYGHRSITHSLLALVGLSTIVYLIQGAHCPETPITTVFGIAYSSHLVLDMLTLQGIPLLYPFKRNPFVVPGNPNLRFETNNMRHEMLAFSFFLVLGLSMKPLMANGFWTSYNSLFGTLKHLTSEFHKSKDLLLVTFNTQKGSIITPHTGLCIEVDEKNIVIITKSKQFQRFDGELDMITEVSPQHTKMFYRLETGNFENITSDSLLRLFNASKYTNLQLQATRSFEYEENKITSTQKTLKLSYPNSLIIRSIKDKPRSAWIPTEKINIKKNEIALLKKSYQDDLQIYQNNLDLYSSTKYKIETTTDYVEKEILMERLSSMKNPKAPQSIQSRLDRLNFELKALKASENNRYQNHLNQNRPGPLLFNGTFTKLLINDTDI